GKTVVTVTTDRTIRVWEFPSGKEIRRISLPAPNLSSTQRIRAALSNDGKIIATWLSEEASAIYLHDITSGKRLPKLSVSSAVAELAFSPNTAHLACLTDDGKVRIWDWAKAREVRTFAAGKPIRVVGGGPGGGICYAPDGKAIATRLPNQVKLWDPAT